MQVPLQHCELVWQVSNELRHIWQVLLSHALLQHAAFEVQNSIVSSYPNTCNPYCVQSSYVPSTKQYSVPFFK